MANAGLPFLTRAVAFRIQMGSANGLLPKAKTPVKKPVPPTPKSKGSSTFDELDDDEQPPQETKKAQNMDDSATRASGVDNSVSPPSPFSFSALPSTFAVTACSELQCITK